MLDHKIDVNNEATEKNRCCVSLTKRESRIAIELLNHHADVNIQDEKGNTMLMLATESQNYKIVIELLNNHADVNVKKIQTGTRLSCLPQILSITILGRTAQSSC